MARILGASLLSVILAAGCAAAAGPSSTPTASATQPPSTQPPSTAEPAATPSTVTPAPSVALPTPFGRLGTSWRFFADAPRVAAVTGTPTGWIGVGSELKGDEQSQSPAAWTSTQGSGWQPATVAVPPGELEGEMQLVTAGTAGELFAAGATGLTHGVVWRSTDGRSWTVSGSGLLFDLGPCYEGCARLMSIAAGPAGIAVAGYRVVEKPTIALEVDIWSSADGTAWVRHVVPGRTGTRVSAEVSVVATTKGFLAAGTLCAPDGTACRAVAWRSANGADWSSPADLPKGAGAGALKALDGPAATVVLGQRCGDECRLVAWASADGSEWRVSDLADQQVTAIWPGFVTLAGSAYLVLGSRGEAVEVWSSVDGLAWREEALAPGAFLPVDELLLSDLAGRTDGAIVVGLGPGETPGMWLSP